MFASDIIKFQLNGKQYCVHYECVSKIPIFEQLYTNYSDGKIYNIEYYNQIDDTIIDITLKNLYNIPVDPKSIGTSEQLEYLYIFMTFLTIELDEIAALFNKLQICDLISMDTVLSYDFMMFLYKYKIYNNCPGILKCIIYNIDCNNINDIYICENSFFVKDSKYIIEIIKLFGKSRYNLCQNIVRNIYKCKYNRPMFSNSVRAWNSIGYFLGGSLGVKRFYEIDIIDKMGIELYYSAFNPDNDEFIKRLLDTMIEAYN